MFNFIKNIKNLSQYKAKTIDEFVEVIKKENCSTVAVEPYLETRGGTKTKTVGIITNFQHMLSVTAMTPGGRKIFYRERLFERFGSVQGIADAEKRCEAAIMHFLFGEQKMRELRTKLPGVSVDIIDPNGRPMDDAMFTKLHQDATTYGVSV